MPDRIVILRDLELETIIIFYYDMAMCMKKMDLRNKG